MRKLFIILSAVILIAGCKSEEEKNLEIMESQIKKSWIDSAFKDNSTVDFLDFHIVEHTIKDENYLDTLRIYKNLEKIEYWSEMLHDQRLEVEDYSRKARLYRGAFGANDDISQIARKNLEEADRIFHEYYDSLQIYFKNDSIIRERISDRKSPQKYTV